jgi:peptidoglycan/xylan/chitin deacetylase (PgdA/CDA1 family)
MLACCAGTITAPMNDRAREDRRRPRGSPLTAGELTARRVAWRRRRARRRWAALIAVLAAGALVLGVVVLFGGRSATSRAVAAFPSSASGGAHPVSHASLRVVRPTTSGQAQAVDRVLRYTSYVQLAGPRRREVALTLDDGPSRHTPEILRVLRRMHAAATFFVIGRSARAYPQLVAAEVRAGCEVEDHTENHPPLGLLSTSAQTAEITRAAQAIHEAGAPYPLLLRPPYGSFDQATLQILHAHRILMVLWSADTKDYALPGVHRIIYTAVSGARPGAIILMHDGGGNRAETVAALPRIITRLRQRGFRLVTVSQLIADDPPPTNQPPPHPLSGRG